MNEKQLACPRCKSQALHAYLNTREYCLLVEKTEGVIDYRNIDLVESEIDTLFCERCGWELEVNGMTDDEIVTLLESVGPWDQPPEWWIEQYQRRFSPYQEEA